MLFYLPQLKNDWLYRLRNNFRKLANDLLDALPDSIYSWDAEDAKKMLKDVGCGDVPLDKVRDCIDLLMMAGYVVPGCLPGLYKRVR